MFHYTSSRSLYDSALHARQSQQGFTSVVILFAAAILAFFSIGLVQVGEVSIEVNMEKQMLDTHAVMVGKSVITRGRGYTCLNGVLSDGLKDESNRLFNQIDTMNADDREYTCEEISDELIERGEGDPDGPPGTFRRYRIQSKVKASVFGSQDEDEFYTREAIIEIREINGEIAKDIPQVMFLLDYSGSMLGNRIQQLKGAVNFFMDQDYPMDYGVIIYDTNVRRTVGVDTHANNFDTVDQLVNQQQPDGTTNFGDPLINAVDLLKRRNGHKRLFIVLISDGYPNAGPDPYNVVEQHIRSIDEEACTTGNSSDPCITVYTLGVDDADENLLKDLSGSVATNANERNKFFFKANAAGTRETFDKIVRDILCTYGPMNPPPVPGEEESINIFIDDEPLKVGDDFVYVPANHSIRFLDAACDDVIDKGGDIIIRYGQPRLIIEQ